MILAIDLCGSSAKHLVKHAVDPMLGSSTMVHIHHDASHGFECLTCGSKKKIHSFTFTFSFSCFAQSHLSFFFSFSCFAHSFFLSTTSEYSLSFKLKSGFLLFFQFSGLRDNFLSMLTDLYDQLLYTIYISKSMKACVVSI